MGVTSGAGTANLPEHLSSPPVFSGVRVARSLFFCVVFLLFFFFWPFCCPSFFDLWILITPSNSSHHLGSSEKIQPLTGS
jgi:hypothetical protein